MKIEFVRRPSPFRTCDDFLRKLLLYGEYGQLCVLLDAAFKHNGYIAGGAAVTMAQILLSKTSKEDLCEALYSKFMMGSKPISYNNYASQHKQTVVGDIDVFFPTHEDALSFVNYVASIGHVGCASVLGTAIEYVRFGNSPYKLQAIVKYTSPPDIQMQTFDIYNAMVAFDGTNFIVPREWEDLDQKHVLHVANWKCDWVIKRVMKYMSKYRYNSLTQQTADEVFKSFLSEMKMIEENDLSVRNRKFKSTTTDGLVHEMRKFVASLSNDNLVELSSYIPDTAYDAAFSELAKRGKVI